MIRRAAPGHAGHLEWSIIVDLAWAEEESVSLILNVLGCTIARAYGTGLRALIFDDEHGGNSHTLAVGGGSACEVCRAGAGGRHCPGCGG